MSNFRGISLEQDGRFTNAEARLMKTMSFPPDFSEKVDMSKVNLEVIKPWIEDKVIAMMGVEDDVVVDFAVGLLEESGSPDPRKIQISLTGFLEKNAPAFTKELWNLLLSAQDNPTGIPTELIELKKAEMRARKEEDDRIRQNIQGRQPPNGSFGGRGRVDTNVAGRFIHGPQHGREERGQFDQGFRGRGMGERDPNRRDVYIPGGRGGPRGNYDNRDRRDSWDNRNPRDNRDNGNGRDPRDRRDDRYRGRERDDSRDRRGRSGRDERRNGRSRSPERNSKAFSQAPVVPPVERDVTPVYSPVKEKERRDATPGRSRSRSRAKVMAKDDITPAHSPVREHKRRDASPVRSRSRTPEKAKVKTPQPAPTAEPAPHQETMQEKEDRLRAEILKKKRLSQSPEHNRRKSTGAADLQSKQEELRAKLKASMEKKKSQEQAVQESEE
ncbi:hypothetical protein YB2330_003273 [Saitoella coloradoensis]